MQYASHYPLHRGTIDCSWDEWLPIKSAMHLYKLNRLSLALQPNPSSDQAAVNPKQYQGIQY